uniref:Putative secreted peptide n=1 Tax=Anopheles braziliensis TaxID=58242 RepID=A0A2M3ZXF9_9DIPT
MATFFLFAWCAFKTAAEKWHCMMPARDLTAVLLAGWWLYVVSLLGIFTRNTEETAGRRSRPLLHVSRALFCL